eukprot:TRINITY_DN40122_c0_g1_i1.p1 TRINITY_DN40122_c0_g1~~TRINITY_DN40122_c0_g1_i1.p1  ORF type:complete len:281 (-),score=33.66 TRINITY_DN40122_c0_g1_i1:7-849(-)
MLNRWVCLSFLLVNQIKMLARAAVETLTCGEEAANGKYCTKWSRRYVYIGMAAAGGGCGRKDCEKIGTADCSCTKAIASGDACADYICNEQGYPGSGGASVETTTCIEESASHCRKWQVKYSYIGMAAAGGGCGRTNCDKVGTATCACINTNTTETFYSCAEFACEKDDYPGSASSSSEKITCRLRSEGGSNSDCKQWHKRITYTGMAAAGGGCGRADCQKDGDATCDCMRALTSGLRCADYKCDMRGYQLIANSCLSFGISFSTAIASLLIHFDVVGAN